MAFAKLKEKLVESLAIGHAFGLEKKHGTLYVEKNITYRMKNEMERPKILFISKRLIYTSSKALCCNWSAFRTKLALYIFRRIEDILSFQRHLNENLCANRVSVIQDLDQQKRIVL